MQATIQNGEVKQLQFRDFKKLIADTNGLDEDSRKEVEELAIFAEDFLTPGGIEQFWV